MRHICSALCWATKVLHVVHRSAVAGSRCARATCRTPPAAFVPAVGGHTSPPCCRPLPHPVTVVDREVTVDDLKPMNDWRNNHEFWYQVRAWPDRL